MVKLIYLFITLSLYACGHPDDASDAPIHHEGMVRVADLYTQNCSRCHGQLAVSKKRNRTPEQIKKALQTIEKMKSIRLNDTQIIEIARLLKD